MKFIKILVICFFVLSSCSSRLSDIDRFSRNNADKVVDSIFGDEIKGFNYLIFSVAEKDFIIIIEKSNSYEEYFYNDKIEYSKIIENKIIYKKEDVFFKKMFNKDIYNKEFITFNSKFFNPSYEISSGNITYFVFKNEKGHRFGEARLSFFIKPNPIEPDIYIFLTNEILKANGLY
ncbi:hypothetical protein [uncultured Flavobacterium sp.]|uniref:hypothetical protein n=1 Tax=uncultured Flavobacterium sp. TaxID=165435 RepID=UPI0025CDC766|nr:hypothetical protein [uncultured Flavobacterium sp.]